MESIRIFVDLKDKSFEKAFVRGLAKRSRNIIYSSVTGRELVREGELPEDCDLYICDEESPIEDARCVRICKEEGTGDGKIYRFEDAGIAVDQLIYRYYLLTGRVCEYRKRGRAALVSFVSPEGGSGTTSCAIATASMMNRIYGERVLYIDLARLNGGSKFLGYSDGDMDKFLYDLYTGRDFPITSFIGEYNDFDYLMLPVINRFSGELSRQMRDRLIDMIDSLGKYRYVFFDIGTDVSQAYEDLCAISGLEVIVRRSGKERIDAVKKIAEHLEDMGADHIHVSNMGKKIQKDDPAISDTGMIYPAEQRICYERKAFIHTQGRIMMDLRGDYGMDIARLTKSIRGRLNGSGIETEYKGEDRGEGGEAEGSGNRKLH